MAKALPRSMVRNPCWRSGRRIQNGGDDRRIARAPADVARQHVADLALVGRRHLAQEMRRRAQDARACRTRIAGRGGRAKARCSALSVPGSGEPLDGDDVGAVGLHRVLRAAAHRAAVDQDGAGAAHAVLAADMHAECLQLVAQEIAEQHARLGLSRAALAVQGQLDAAAFARCAMQHGHCSALLRCRASATASWTARRRDPASSAIR